MNTRSLIDGFASGALDGTHIRTLGAVSPKRTFDPESVGGRPIHMDVSIFDIMGNRTFLVLLHEAYFHGAHGILAVADLTWRGALDALGVWISSVESVSGKLPVLSVANKADLNEHSGFGPS